MAKATTLPNDLKKSQVVLNTYDEASDTTKVVTRDGVHWYSKSGGEWTERDPNNGGPLYDPAQEEQNDPEAMIREEQDVLEGEEEEPPAKTEAELKAEAAANKAAKARTVAAQAIAASEGSGEASKQNNLLNRQARLAGEGVTSSHVVDSGPGGSGGIRTLTEREIEILEGSEAAKAARKDERPTVDTGGPVVDEEGRAHARIMDDTKQRDEIAALKAEIAKLQSDLRQKNNMVLKQQVALRGSKEGPPVDESAPVFLAPSPMAGVYPHNTDEMPTVDQINARNGQPERSPRPAVRGSKQRDEQGYPIVPPEQKTDA